MTATRASFAAVTSQSDTLFGQVLDEFAALRARVEALEARHGVRDAAETAALPAIGASIGSGRFTSRDLMKHRKIDDALAAALEAADVTTTKELGKLLARLEVQPIGGLRLARVGMSRGNVIVWQVQVSNPQTGMA